jgi:hypothetical protein
MIIKSMSRKKATFGQLIDYIQTGASSERYTFYHNTTERHAEGLKREFIRNSRFLRQRKNGVFLYHEIISIKRNNTISLEEQKAKLSDIVRLYIEARSPRQLAFGMLHDDHTEHLHFHLVISANQVEQAERVRLTKKQFSDIQTHLERYVLTHYPELNQQAVFTPNQTPEQQKAKAKHATLSNAGAELKRRTSKTPKRDQIKETLEAIFTTSTTPQDFTEAMSKAGFTFYQRGKYAGITDRDGIKYRFATLGLAEQWPAFDEKMRASMNQATNTPKSAESTVSVRSKTPYENTQYTSHTEANKTHKGRETTIIEDRVTDTLDSAKDLLNDVTDFNSFEAEQQRRFKEMQERREQQANNSRANHQHGQGQKPKP